MPGPVPGIHDYLSFSKKDVDGRDKPGHDARGGLPPTAPCLFPADPLCLKP